MTLGELILSRDWFVIAVAYIVPLFLFLILVETSGSEPVTIWILNFYFNL